MISELKIERKEDIQQEQHSEEENDQEDQQYQLDDIQDNEEKTYQLLSINKSGPQEYQFSDKLHQQQEIMKKNIKSRKKNIKRPLKPKHPKIIKLDVSVQARNSMYSSNSKPTQPLINESSQVSGDGSHFRLFYPVKDQLNIKHAIGNVLITEFLLNESNDKLKSEQIEKDQKKHETEEETNNHLEQDKKKCKFTIGNVLTKEFIIEKDSIVDQKRNQKEKELNVDDKKTQESVDASLTKDQEKIQNKNKIESFNKSEKNIFSDFYTDSYNLGESTNSIAFEIEEKCQISNNDLARVQLPEADMIKCKHKISELQLEELEEESDKVSKSVGKSGHASLFVHPPKDQKQPDSKLVLKSTQEEEETTSRKERNLDQGKQSDAVQMQVHKPKEQPQSLARQCKNTVEEFSTSKSGMSETEESEKAIRTEKFFLVFPQELTTSIGSEQPVKCESTKTPEKASLSLLDLEGFSESTTNAEAHNIVKLTGTKTKDAATPINASEKPAGMLAKQPIKIESPKLAISSTNAEKPNNTSQLNIDKTKSSEKEKPNPASNNVINTNTSTKNSNVEQPARMIAKQPIKAESPKLAYNSANIENPTQTNSVCKVTNDKTKSAEKEKPNASSNDAISADKPTQKFNITQPAAMLTRQHNSTQAFSISQLNSNKTKDAESLKISINTKEPPQAKTIKQSANTIARQLESLKSSKESLPSILVNPQKERAKSETRTYKCTIKEEDLNPHKKQKQNSVKKSKPKFSVHAPKGKKPVHKSTYDPSIFYTPMNSSECLLSDLEDESEKAVKTEKFFLSFRQELVTSTESEKDETQKASLRISAHPRDDYSRQDTKQSKSKLISECLLLDLEGSEILNCHDSNLVEPEKNIINNAPKLLLVHKPEGVPHPTARQYNYKVAEKSETSKTAKQGSLSLLELECSEKLDQSNNSKQITRTYLKQPEKTESNKTLSHTINTGKPTQTNNSKQLTSTTSKQLEKTETAKTTNNAIKAGNTTQTGNIKSSTNTISKQLEKTETAKTTNNAIKAGNTTQTGNIKSSTNTISKQLEKTETAKTTNNAINAQKLSQTSNSKQVISTISKQPERVEISNKTINAGNQAQTSNIKQLTSTISKQPEKAEPNKATINTNKLNQTGNIKQSTNTIPKQQEKAEPTKKMSNTINAEKPSQTSNAKQLMNTASKQPGKTEPTKILNKTTNINKLNQTNNSKQSTNTTSKQPGKEETTKASNNTSNVSNTAQRVNNSESTIIKTKYSEKEESHKSPKESTNQKQKILIAFSNIKQSINTKTTNTEKAEINKTSNNSKDSKKFNPTSNIKQSTRTISKQPEKAEFTKATNNTNNTSKPIQTQNIKQSTNINTKNCEKNKSTKSTASFLVHAQKEPGKPETIKSTIEENLRHESKGTKQENSHNTNNETKSKTSVQDSKEKKSAFKSGTKSNLSKHAFKEKNTKNDSIIRITVTLKDIGLEGLDSLTPNRAVEIRRRYKEKEKEAKEKEEEENRKSRQGIQKSVQEEKKTNSFEESSRNIKARPATSASEFRKNTKQTNLHESNQFNRTEKDSEHQSERTPIKYYDDIRERLPPILNCNHVPSYLK